MADRDVLLALADRCEREAPSYELNRDISLGCGIPLENGGWAAHFSHSLDAAVTLEPADAQEVCVRKYSDGGIYVRLTDARGVPIYLENFAAERPITEPMARLAVYLRARASMEQENTNG